MQQTVYNINRTSTSPRTIFFGEKLALQRYDKMKYPKMYQLAEEMDQFLWRPTDIDLSLDRGQYKALNEVERHVFDSNLMWQTMQDSMLSRSITSVMPFVSLEEVEAAFNTWIYFESRIHSNSYSHILRNVYPNETVMWDNIENHAEIKQRASEVRSKYDEIFDPNETDMKQFIYDWLITTQITEGVAFYVSFACSFFFKAKGSMVGNGSIIQLIARDENLHVAVTQNIIKWLRDNPEEGFQDVIERSKAKVIHAFATAVEQEKRWIRYLFSKGPLLGLNADNMEGYLEWVCNNRMRALDIKPLFPNRKTNPLGTWYEQFSSSKNTQSAPQETEITSYRVGAADSSIDESKFADIDL